MFCLFSSQTLSYIHKLPKYYLFLMFALIYKHSIEQATLVGKYVIKCAVIFKFTHVQQFQHVFFCFLSDSVRAGKVGIMKFKLKKFAQSLSSMLL